MIHEAMFYEKLAENKVRCSLCAHRCKIAPGKRGICRVRENCEGSLFSLVYGEVASEAVAHIEKKPLYHYYPGSSAYSVGTIGCNFRCRHCQNWRLSRAVPEDVYLATLSPRQLILQAKMAGCQSVSWTYNEPTIWYEYTYDGAKLAKEEGLGTSYVTNGYITPEALKRIAPYLDAFSVDIKGFSEAFYRDVCSAKLAPVLEAARLAKELGIHVEVVNLVIPTHNDSPDELRELSKWVYENLGRDTPLHFNRFHPHYEMKDLPPTPVKTLDDARSIAIEEGMRFVYVGNVPGHPHENTYCPECGSLLIARGFFEVQEYNISPEKTCPKCGEAIPIVGEYAGKK
ncbi:AmmeMemoRadiSam system radical SAM enzyme [Methanosarcina sp. KYL-1]|uniref:AmmeMemoRadiSam system radical SAM enzyme n=1 Tax=Methanosarcina sp. KYL-1 TaxID=2602068 RepID=UPI002101A657|nr:AmmeMemoRadiSam system radical SAM enzyme [Methanosarcina sp. KYL-1]MCQ1535320.1 AmmeMemoRadiSam system radical SAM enzyme [Methanosarcina sp. KYL-1]